MTHFCISDDAFDGTESKSTETTLEHLMCCFHFFFNGSKHGDSGSVSAAQQPILLKTDVARVGVETKTMAGVFMIFQVSFGSVCSAFLPECF